MTEQSAGNSTMRPFCDNPQGVYDAILETDPLGKGTVRLAQRLHEEFGRRNAGFHNGKPIVFLIVGDADSRIDEKIDAIGKTFIGQPIMFGIPSVTAISCSEFLSTQGMEPATTLAPLIGPASLVGFPPRLDSSLYQRADKMHRIGREHMPLAKILLRIAAAGENEDRGSQKLKELQKLFKEISERIQQIEEEHAPYHSVLAFTSIEFAFMSPQLFRVVREVCKDGFTLINDGERIRGTYFGESIVLLTLTWNDKTVPLAKEPGETSESRFRRILAALKRNRFAELLLDDTLGEERIVIIDPPDRPSLTVRLALCLERIEKKLRASYGIEATFTDDFCAFVLDHCVDSTERFEGAYVRYVIGPLAEKVILGKLSRNAVITFGAPDPGDDKKKPLLSVTPGEGDIITPSEIALVFSEVPLLDPPETAEAEAFRKRLEKIVGEPIVQHITPPGQYL